jgi:hypothetical protein
VINVTPARILAGVTFQSYADFSSSLSFSISRR